MNLQTIDKENSITKVRENILEFENYLKTLNGAKIGDSELAPVKHSFFDGVYIREMFIPKGTAIVGKIHKHEHPTFILKGDITVFSEDMGKKRLIAPQYFISPAGTKRAVYAHEDTVWITIHENKTNTKDLKVLEKENIVQSYKELNA